MKGTIIAIALSVAAVSVAKAEVVSDRTVDTSLVVVVYDHKVIDTVINHEDANKEAILISNNYVKQQSWGSLLAAKEISQLPEDVREMKTDEAKSRVFSIWAKNRSHNETIIKDLASKELTHKKQMGIESNFYTEPIPEFDWTIDDVVSDTIIGYPCKKASCRFRGRDWNVWFTEAIPISQGPWKLAGLPGMILKAVDGTDTHFWTATLVTDEKFPITVPLEEYAKKHYFKVPRERFWKYYEDNRLRPMTYLINSGAISDVKNPDGTPAKVQNRRRHYNPEELE